MKRFLTILFLCLFITGCTPSEPAQIAATTLPVYEFTSRLCAGTGLTVTRLVTEEVSCLHDYSLNVRQVKAAEAAEVIVISGAGLEEFMEDLLLDADTIDASEGIERITPQEHHHHHEEAETEEHHDGHHHQEDPHIWLSPAHASIMAENICRELTERYPGHSALLEENLSVLLRALEKLNIYGQNQLKDLSCRDLITFHDGFSYFAHAFDLHILRL